MQHVMLDLETWGTVPGCAIRSIGAVVFDPSTTMQAGAFYRNIDDAYTGLVKEDRTVSWWEAQSQEAKAALDKDRVPLPMALVDFIEWWRVQGAQYVWSHGASFDVPVLAVAYSKCGIEPPWDFRKVRDTRTLFDIAGVMPATKFGVAHNALDDAIAQAIDVQRAFRVLHDKGTFRTASPKRESYYGEAIMTGGGSGNGS